LVIGDEILSGRTKDKNINTLANKCTQIGIRMMEVRVISDDETKIVDSLNALRNEYNYVFTTGGIGPTHDDITAQSVALAFKVPLKEHREALKILEEHYPQGQFTDARRLMARVPQGGELIKNTISAAPGFMIENVIVMAGVPEIVEVMLDDVTPKLQTGHKLLSRTFKVIAPESVIAPTLEGLQSNHEGLSIGSYPYYRAGEIGTTVVMRAIDSALLDQVAAQLKLGITDHEFIDEGTT